MGIQKKDREYERFLDQISDFIFVEDKPENTVSEKVHLQGYRP